MVKYCRFCGREYETRNGRLICYDPECVARQKEEYRSRDRERHTKHYETTCPVCGKEFIAKSTQIFCSENCRHKAEAIRRSGGEVITTARTECDIRKPKKRKSGIDTILKECKRQGISYGEWQKHKTIEEFAKVEI